MKGEQIFEHALRQVMNNLPATLRVSGALYLVQAVIGLLLGAQLMGAGMGGEMAMRGAAGGLLGGLISRRWRLDRGGVASLCLAQRRTHRRSAALHGRQDGRLFPEGAADRHCLAGDGNDPGDDCRGDRHAFVLDGGGRDRLAGALAGGAGSAHLPGSAHGGRPARRGHRRYDHGFLAGWEATKDDWVSILQLAVIMALAMWVVNLLGFSSLAVYRFWPHCGSW